MKTMPQQLSGRAVEIARLSMTRERLRRPLSDPGALADLSEDERREYRAVRREIQADLDMDQDPDFGPLLAALEEKLGQKRVYETVFHPERFLPNEVTYPISADEVAQVLKRLGVEGLEAWTIERLVDDGLLPPPPQAGGGSLPRNAYFARHVVAAAYRALFVSEKPSELEAEVRVARGEVPEATVAYLRALPRTDPAILSRLTQLRHG